MTQYTEDQVEEMVREAVEKTEKSFGGTFRRLKSENEQLAAEKEDALAGLAGERGEYERRIGELEERLADSRRRLSDLAVRSELKRHIGETGPLPERFVDVAGIEYSDDPEILARNVADAVERGRSEFEAALAELGIERPKDGEQPVPGIPANPANPTNPANRDPQALRDMRKTEARSVLREMTGRGLLR